MRDLGIVIPIYNEAENLPKIMEKLEKYSFFEESEILFVYDESEDNTLQVAKNLSQKYSPLNVLENPYPKGFGWSIKAGLETLEKKYIVVLMADLCDDPQTIEKMYEKAESGFDVVCGSRFMKGGEKIGSLPVKEFFARFVGLLGFHLTGLSTVDCTNAFKMYRKEAIKNIQIEGGLNFAVSMQIVLSSYFQGYEVTEVPTIWRGREQGKSHFSIRNMAPVYVLTFLWSIRKALKYVLSGRMSVNP